VNDCDFLAQEMVSASPFSTKNGDKQEAGIQGIHAHAPPFGRGDWSPRSQVSGGTRRDPCCLQLSKIEVRIRKRAGTGTKIEIDVYLLHTHTFMR